MSAPLRELAKRINRLERELAASRAPQLKHSSIDDGSLDVYDADGSLRAVVGVLPDYTVGVMPVNAPPPPKPGLPQVAEAPRGYVVSWDGTNDDGTDIQPLDWSRMEVHSSVAHGFTPSPATLRGTFESPQGGSLTLMAGPEYVPGFTDEYEVLLIARNTSGTASVPSDRVVVRVGQVAEQDIADFALTVRKMRSLRHELY